MGYSGVKGGMDAILAAERLVRRKRAAAPWAAATAIIESYRLAVDRVMGEAGLYDEAIAADAFRQAEGDLVEAAHLVRAYRSALPRLAVSTPADPAEMTVLRRIVPASRTPDGPQLLGRTTDYTARVLERPQGPVPAPEEPAQEERAPEEHASATAARLAAADPWQAGTEQAGTEQAGPGYADAGYADAEPAGTARASTEQASTEQASTGQAGPGHEHTEPTDPRRPRRFYEQLLKADLAVDHGPVDHGPVDHGPADHEPADHEPAARGTLQHREPADDPEPFDVSRGAARSPAPRSAVLASMARAETGALVALWYRSIRGPDGALHEVTLGELRHGRLPVRVIHPLTGRPVEIGQFRATEAEAIEDLDGPAEDRTRLDVGYGLCFGHNERKAIAMASLDIAYCRAIQSGSGDELEQLLLLTTDGLDSGGFLDHLKLPHYVTFRSIVDRKLAARHALAARELATRELATRELAARELATREGTAREEDGRGQASPPAGCPAKGAMEAEGATRTRSVEGV